MLFPKIAQGLASTPDARVILLFAILRLAVHMTLPPTSMRGRNRLREGGFMRIPLSREAADIGRFQEGFGKGGRAYLG